MSGITVGPGESFGGTPISPKHTGGSPGDDADARSSDALSGKVLKRILATIGIAEGHQRPRGLGRVRIDVESLQHCGHVIIHYRGVLVQVDAELLDLENLHLRSDVGRGERLLGNPEDRGNDDRLDQNSVSARVPADEGNDKLPIRELLPPSAFKLFAPFPAYACRSCPLHECSVITGVHSEERLKVYLIDFSKVRLEINPNQMSEARTNVV